MAPPQHQEDVKVTATASSSLESPALFRSRYRSSVNEEANSISGLTEPLLSSPSATTFVEEEDAQRHESQEDEEPSLSSPPSRNIRYTLLYTALLFAGRSIWSQSVLATYVYLLESNRASAVGMITAVMGLSQLCASIPTGILVDGYTRRDTLTRLASVVGLLSVLVTLLALHTRSFVALVSALSVWGITFGLAQTSVMALFADSIPQGQRSHYFTLRQVHVTLGNTAGPITSLILFACLGDTWRLGDCSIVMSLGQVVCIAGLGALCFLSDDEAVPEAVSTTLAPIDDEAGVVRRECATADAQTGRADSSVSDEEMTAASTGETTQDDNEQTMVVLTSSADSSMDNVAAADNEDSSVSSSLAHWLCGRCVAEHRVIPTLVASADLIAGLGSGMSIRYFPIFFMDNLRLSPVAVQTLYIVTPLIQSVLMKRVQVLSKRIGRCRATVFFKWTGIVFFAAMIFAYQLHLHRWLICLLYVVRTAFMNSTGGLTRSFLMDHVPKHERGKWSALESVNMFSWSGSAFLGGILVGVFGSMIPLFVATASIQLVSSLLIVAMFGVDTIE